MDTLVILYVLVATVVVTLMALCGAFVLVVDEKTLRVWLPRLVSLAVGVLLGDAFLHLLPDAIERMEDASSVFLWTLMGVLGFYTIEQFLFWRHHHQVPENLPQPGSESHRRPRTYTRMNLIGDGIHNFVDGALIAGSFLADPMLGIAVTLAIIAHEIPQEISDIAVLIHGGIPKRRAVVLNLLCASTCIAGGMLTLLLAHLVEFSLGPLLAVTAGGFIYIATTDLMPLLRERGSLMPLPQQMSATAVGVLAMQAIVWLE